MKLHNRLLGVAVSLATTLAAFDAGAARFQSDWPSQVSRPWVGRQYWANPLQDWRISEGRLECVRAASNRNVHLLTHRIGDGPGQFNVSVRLGSLDSPMRGTAGMRIGIRGPLENYRSALLFGKGVDVGIRPDGALFIGRTVGPPSKAAGKTSSGVELRLAVTPTDSNYRLLLSAHDPHTGNELSRVAAPKMPAEQLIGNVALVSNHQLPVRGGKARQTPAGRYWFSDWRLSGTKVEAHPEDAFGPILFAMHTLSRGVLKMTAQMPPIGPNESQTIHLEILKENQNQWTRIASSTIDPLSRTATFRVVDWDDQRDVPYRLVYSMTEADGSRTPYDYAGTVRRDPVDKPTIVVAGFTGHQDYLFPNSLLAGNVAKLAPDVLVFTGDQLYEGNAGYGIVRQPVDVASLDYLRKWYVFGWGFRDLMRDCVTLCLPDDHDVYQGNIWGQGGRDCGGMPNHSQGGYAMHADWVNTVQRTQSSHHPDPYDPTPIDQDITVYYGPMTYGRIGFAVLEDRKFKSGPEGKVNTWKGRPDHVTDPDLDPQTLDKPGLTLLGDRQLEFLRNWTTDWRGTDMKMAVSQTIFANVANYHGPRQMYLVADLDSNGWPQSARNRALAALRRGFVFHLAGDQHLASIVHHGINTWRDSIFSFCVPSIAAGYPRSWLPEREGKTGQNRGPGMPPTTGDFLDGLGNHISVYAVGNPQEKQRTDPLGRGHDKASGFGIVRLDKTTRKITMECWRLLVDPTNPKPGDQFPGFPMTIDQIDNFGQSPVAHLPTVKVKGLSDPVVQVIDENDGQTVYSLRIRGATFRPKVFRNGPHTVRVGNPDTGQWKTFSDVDPAHDRTMDVEF